MVEDTLASLGVAESDRATAQRQWSRLEAVHTVVYYSPIVADAHARVGLEPGLMAYTAARIGPLGAVGPEVAAATFYGFSARALAELLPAAWDWAEPMEVVLATREAVGRTLAPFCDGIEDDIVRAAELAREVADLHPVAGRTMAAARSALPWPDQPHAVLWEAATRIRESRGDGHIAALVAAGVGGIESHLLLRGDSAKLRRILTPLRGWTDAEWDLAVARMIDVGWLNQDARPTPAAVDLYQHIEARTDALAAPPWRAFGAAPTRQLDAALQPLVERLLDSGLLPGVITRRVQQ